MRLAARLVTRASTLSVILNDLSLLGANVQAMGEMSPGSEAMLFWDRYDIFGEVVWTGHGRCGLLFLETVAPKVLIATRDLDDIAHLPRDRDIVRQTAQTWVEGKTRL